MVKKKSSWESDTVSSVTPRTDRQTVGARLGRAALGDGVKCGRETLNQEEP